MSRDWRFVRWAKVPMLSALKVMRFRLPGLAARELPKLGVDAMWVYHPLVSPQLGRICQLAGVELIAWKPTEEKQMRRLLEIGASGICSSEPQSFAGLRDGLSVSR